MQLPFNPKSKIQNLKSKIALLGISLSVIFPLGAIAQSAPASVTPPLNCPPLQSRAQPVPTTTLGSVRTANTISPTGLTPPSLWWAEQQFSHKLLDNWCAYPDQRRVDLVVNRQIWSLLTYLERYEFVNHFGTVARDFKYNVRVFNQQGAALATYTCNFSVTPERCELWVDGANTGGRLLGGQVENEQR